MKRTRSRAVAAAVAGVMLLAGCSSEPGVGDSLDFGGGAGTACIPIAAGPVDVNYGFEAATNRQNLPITLQSASLIDAQNVSVVDAYVLPIPTSSRTGSIGVWPVWPPAAEQLAGLTNTKLDPLSGFQVPSAGGGLRYNVVLHLKAQQEPASFAAMRLAYTVDGKEYFQDGSTQLVMATECK